MLKKRCFLFIAIVFSILTLISVRFFCFSVLKNSTFRKLAFSQQTSSVRVQNLRGNICDRNMIQLTNTTESDMYLDKNGQITTRKTPFSFRDTLRYSPSNTASHIIGHTDSSSNGISGIEKAFDPYIRTDAFSSVSFFSNAVGSPIGEIRKNTSANTGATVVLTIDSHIQKIVESVMKKHITTGAAVVLDTKTSDILACVSLPTYDPSNVENYLHSQNGELINRAFTAYDAGSVFKIVTSAAAFSKNPVYHQRCFWCNGEYIPDSSSVFECHKKDGHGFIDMKDAFAKSCNCAFYETGLCTGAQDICNTARAFGFGQKLLSINMEESPGNIPQKTDYSDFETMNMSIGQGEILITPLQCTLMCATIANSGLRNRVNLVQSVMFADGTSDSSFYIRDTIPCIAPETALLIGDMMRESVLSGTATPAYSSSVTIAGKTGSAQTGWQNPDGSLKVHGWFCGFFPYENPRYAMTVFCEDGKSGAQSCITPFVEIAESIMRIYPPK